MVDLDGTDGYINCGNDSSLDFVAQNFTIAMWINLKSFAQNELLYCRGLYRVDGIYCQIQSNPPGTAIKNLRMVLNKTPPDNPDTRTVDNVLSANQSYHVVFQRVGTVGKIFVNGVECSYAFQTILSNPTTSSRNAYIGIYDNLALATDPKISEFAIWDVALPLTEISLLANSKIKRLPLQIQPSNLKLYLPLDEVADGVSIHGQTFKDLSGNNNNGTGSDAGGESVGRAEEVLSYP